MLFCRHKELKFVDYLYDNSVEAKKHGGKTKKYKCKKCGKYIYKKRPISCDGCMGKIQHDPCKREPRKENGCVCCWYSMR